jgi:hypothetical protein
MRSGNHNFLETAGPLQACNGAASQFDIHWSYSQRLLMARRLIQTCKQDERFYAFLRFISYLVILASRGIIWHASGKSMLNDLIGVQNNF